MHRLSPGGLMQVVARLPDERGREVLQAVAPATAAGALAAASPDLAGRLLAELPAEDAGALLGRMPIDDAALALRGLAPERSAPLLERLPRERVDVVTGAVMTGVIGTFVVVACAATLHADGRSIDTARDPALALEPLAGNLAATLFGAVLLGAALLTAAILPLATAYSVTDLLGYEAALDDPLREAPSSTRATPSSWRSGAGSCCCRARRWSRSCSSPGRSTRSSCCR